MIRLFFPSSAFAWLFTALLLGLLVAASWSDLRRMVVPKWITLTTLGLGLIANMARGAWLGYAGLPTWILTGSRGFGLGVTDGLLFGLCGAAVGFGVMFALWVLGVCGGGDVKLYAAVGAWIGPWYIFPVLGLAGVCLAVVGIAGVLLRLLRGKAPQTNAGAKPPKTRLVAFSWPLAIGAFVVLAYLLGNDLMTIQHAQTLANQVQNDAR